MTTLFQIEEEISFWKRQIQEHQFFIYQGLTDYALKNEALNLYHSWGIIKPDELFCLIEKTNQFQSTLLKTKKWIGWLSFSFIEHLQKELHYFKNKLTHPQYRLEEELKFWLWHHESEMAAAEKLIDPKEEELCDQIKDYILTVQILKDDLPKLQKNYKNLHYKTTKILIDYINDNNKLEEMMINKTVLVNIPLLLIQHVIREGERALTIMNSL